MGFNGLGHLVRVDGRGAFGLDDHANGQAELAREFKITLVVGGHGHDGAGAIAHQNVIRNPDGDALARGRVDGIATGEHAGFFTVHRFALDIGLAFCLFLVGLHFVTLGRGGNFVHQRMLRGEHHERDTPKCVRPGGEYFNRVLGFGWEDD